MIRRAFALRTLRISRGLPPKSREALTMSSSSVMPPRLGGRLDVCSWRLRYCRTRPEFGVFGVKLTGLGRSGGGKAKTSFADLL